MSLKHIVLKSVAVASASIFILVLAHFVSLVFEVTPHVVLSYLSAGSILGHVMSVLYDHLVRNHALKGTKLIVIPRSEYHQLKQEQGETSYDKGQNQQGNQDNK